MFIKINQGIMQAHIDQSRTHGNTILQSIQALHQKVADPSLLGAGLNDTKKQTDFAAWEASARSLTTSFLNTISAVEATMVNHMELDQMLSRI